jgi:hypothetical protein
MLAWTRKGVAGAARRGYAGGRVLQLFSLRGQVEVVELLWKVPDIGLWRSMAICSLATMNGLMDR